MSHRYRYTHGISAVMPFTHGQEGVAVHRSPEALAALGAEPEVGTVVLGLGDEITLADEYKHPYLTTEGTDQRAPAAKATAKEAAASPPAALTPPEPEQPAQGEKAAQDAEQPPAEADSVPAPTDEAPAAVETAETGKG